MASNSEIAKILVFIGGILGFLQGITTIIGWTYTSNLLYRIVAGILAIFLGLALIVSSDYIKFEFPVKIPFEKLILLIVGIVFLILGSQLGGILIIIAAVLLFVE